jgi:perosamine synthetase
MHKITQVMPYIDASELELLKTSVEQKWLTEGPYSEKFIDYIKTFTKSKYAVLAPNGTLGLFLALLALDLPKDSEIIIPSFTFYASATAAIFAGLKPVFADVDENTFNIDVLKLETLITNKTSAIMPVHIYGHSANMSKIIELADKYNLKIIEDAAQGYGVTYKKNHVGTFGDISMISFFADKTITMGEGAVVLTQNETLYKKLKLLRNQGRFHSGTFIHQELGMNFRVTDMQAAVGFAQVNKFQNILNQKLKNYEAFKNGLADIGDLKFISIEKDSTFVPFRFFIKTRYKIELMKFLENNGIQTRSFFYPMHLQPKLKQYCNYKIPITEKLYNQGICLPLHFYLKKDEIMYIINSIVKFFDKVKVRTDINYSAKNLSCQHH